MNCYGLPWTVTVFHGLSWTGLDFRDIVRFPVRFLFKLVKITNAVNHHLHSALLLSLGVAHVHERLNEETSCHDF